MKFIMKVNLLMGKKKERVKYIKKIKVWNMKGNLKMVKNLEKEKFILNYFLIQVILLMDCQWKRLFDILSK